MFVEHGKTILAMICSFVSFTDRLKIYARWMWNAVVSVLFCSLGFMFFSVLTKPSNTLCLRYSGFCPPMRCIRQVTFVWVAKPCNDKSTTCLSISEELIRYTNRLFLHKISRQNSISEKWATQTWGNSIAGTFGLSVLCYKEIKAPASCLFGKSNYGNNVLKTSAAVNIDTSVAET